MPSLFQYESAICSEKYNLLYFPIPKNASTTIHHWFMKEHDLMDDLYEYSKKNPSKTHNFCRLRLGLNRRVSYKYLEKFLEKNDFFTFSVVRNPWARLASCYIQKFIVSNLEGFNLGINSLFYKDNSKRISFNDLLYYVLNVSDDELDPHLKPQSYFVPEDIKVNIFDMDHLDALVQKLNNEFDFNASLDLKMKKTKCCDIDISGCLGDISASLLNQPLSSYLDYRNFYSPESAKKLLIRYKDDVDRFGYTF
jgi:hypothetical protein